MFFSRRTSCNFSISGRLPTHKLKPVRRCGIANTFPTRRVPIVASRRKESGLYPTNGHGCKYHGRAPATSRGRRAHKKLEALGPILVGAAVGDRARRLFALRKLLGLFSARSRAQPRVSLG